MANVRLKLFEIEIGGGYIRVFPCHDADFFSDSALRSMLLSQDGRQILAAFAVSRKDGRLTVRGSIRDKSES